MAVKLLILPALSFEYFFQEIRCIMHKKTTKSSHKMLQNIIGAMGRFVTKYCDLCHKNNYE